MIMLMGAIQVKDVPDPLHDALRRRAAEEGMSLTDYVLEVLRRDLALPGRREWLERLATRDPVGTAGALDALDAARGEREVELGDARRR
jgi:plasmid stability protein